MMMTTQQTLKESTWRTKYYTADAEASGKLICSFIDVYAFINIQILIDYWCEINVLRQYLDVNDV